MSDQEVGIMKRRDFLKLAAIPFVPGIHRYPFPSEVTHVWEDTVYPDRFSGYLDEEEIVNSIVQRKSQMEAIAYDNGMDAFYVPWRTLATELWKEYDDSVMRMIDPLKVAVPKTDKVILFYARRERLMILVDVVQLTDPHARNKIQRHQVPMFVCIRKELL